MLDETFYQQLDQLYATGRTADAEAFLTDTLSVVGTDEENHADRATVLNELMGHYRTAGDFAACRQAMDSLLYEIRALDLTQGMEYATLMLNVANAQRAMGLLDDSERNFLIVRDEYERALGPRDMRLASLYNNMGLTYRAKHDVARARAYFDRALEIVRTLPEAAKAVSATCSNLADMLADEGDLDEASVYAHEAIGALGGSDLPLSVDLSAALSAAARIDYLRGELQSAIRLYSQAADSIRQAFGKTRAYDTICRNLAEVYRAAGGGADGEYPRVHQPSDAHETGGRS